MSLRRLQPLVPIDLSLASTYVPAVACLLRGSALIILISREWVTQSIPALILLGLVLYVDRVIRREVILDSSALMCTMFVAHVLNVCRSSIAHVDERAAGNYMYLLHEGVDLKFRQNHSHGGAHTLSPAMQHQLLLMQLQKQNQSGGRVGGLDDIWTNAPPGARLMPLLLPWWQANFIYILYALASVLLLMEVDVVGMLMPASPSQQAYSFHGKLAAESLEADAQKKKKKKDGSSASSCSSSSSHAGSVDGSGCAAKARCSKRLGGCAARAVDEWPCATPADGDGSGGLANSFVQGMPSRSDVQPYTKKIGGTPSVAHLACLYDYCSDSTTCCLSEDSEGGDRGRSSERRAANNRGGFKSVAEPCAVRISTVVVHCILVGMVLQMHVTAVAAPPQQQQQQQLVTVDSAPQQQQQHMLFMSPSRVMTRCFAFMCLSVCWTYGVGIVSAQLLKSSRTRMLKERRNHALMHGGGLYSHHLRQECFYGSVQPFTPCQLRFAVLLFLDRWLLMATALCMACILAQRIHVVASAVVSQASLATIPSGEKASSDDRAEIGMTQRRALDDFYDDGRQQQQQQVVIVKQFEEDEEYDREDGFPLVATSLSNPKPVRETYAAPRAGHVPTVLFAGSNHCSEGTYRHGDKGFSRRFADENGAQYEDIQALVSSARGVAPGAPLASHESKHPAANPATRRRKAAAFSGENAPEKVAASQSTLSHSFTASEDAGHALLGDFSTPESMLKMMMAQAHHSTHNHANHLADENDASMDIGGAEEVVGHEDDAAAMFAMARQMQQNHQGLRVSSSGGTLSAPFGERLGEMI